MPDPSRKLTKQSITISLTVIWLVRWQGHASNRHGWDTERAGVKLRTGSLPGDGWYIVHFMCWKRSLRGALFFLTERQILAGGTGHFEIKISQRRFHQSRCVSSRSDGLHWTTFQPSSGYCLHFRFHLMSGLPLLTPMDSTWQFFNPPQG